MKKHLTVSILLTAVIISLVVGRSQAVVSPSVNNYLATIKNSDWAVMAQAALGATPADTSFLKTIDGDMANDYSTYILAITALGKDPRFSGSKDLVTALRQTARDGQIGDANLLYDDTFGLMALVAAGAAANDPLIAQEVQYLKSKQLGNGSWDYLAGSPPGNVDLTAVGIMALRAAGVPATDANLVKAINWLQDAQNDDGGFPEIPKGQSNSESTAWALSAIYSLGDNPDFWSPNGADSPVDYLNKRLSPQGFFYFDAQTKAADNRTPVTTSYAAIALAGKFYPINKLSAPVRTKIRIEGKDSTVCTEQVEARTALGAVLAAVPLCGFSYKIEDTSLGPYLKTINNDQAAGVIGWSFAVNDELITVGPSEYYLAPNDSILLFFGNWNDVPLRLTFDKNSVAVGGSLPAVVERFDYGKKVWQSAAGAIVKRGSEQFTTDGNGRAAITWPQAGVFDIYAQAINSVRSPRVSVKVGEGSGQSQSLPLSVEITQPSPPGGGGGGGNNPPTGPGGGSDNTTPAIVFGVSGDLNFGTLKPGESSAKTATITNSSAVPIKTTAEVSGAQLFVRNLTLDSIVPSSWQKRVEKAQSAAVNVTLSVPADYTASGKEQGTLIFWANPAQ